MKKMALIIILACASLSWAKTMYYSWESGTDAALGSFQTVTADISTVEKAHGSRSLEVTDGGDPGTPQVYIAWIKGLNDGDQVSAYMYAKTRQGNGVRIWAHYTKDLEDINAYAGGTDGELTYSGTDWTKLAHQWTFDASTDRNGLVIEARTYSTTGDGGWVDALTITAPDTAEIVFPGPGIVGEPEVTVDGGGNNDLDDSNWGEPDAVYSWENGGNVVGTHNSLYFENVADTVYDGQQSLLLARGPGSIPEAYLARIKGLTAGQHVKARLYARKGLADQDGPRLWGVYETDGHFSGSAEGNLLNAGTDWTKLIYDWQFDAGTQGDRDTLVIESRLYGNEGNFGWVDKLELWVTPSAVVEFPEPNTPADNLIGSYSWEDGGSVLGSYYYPDVLQSTNAEYYDGSKSLRVVHGASGDSQAYLAWIKNMRHGDKFTVRAYAKATHGAYLSGHYLADNDDPTGYAGRDVYPYQVVGNDWTAIEWTWIFDEGDTTQYDPRVGFMVEGVVTGDQGDEAWFDKIEIYAPDHCTVEFPSGNGEVICYADADLTGDCTVNDQDLVAFGDLWLTDGYQSTVGDDPNAMMEFYRYYQYDWADGNLAVSTYPDDPNGPDLVNILNPDDPNTSGQTSGRVLAITNGSYYDSKIYIAQLNELQHNDRVFVQVRMKSGGIDGADLQLAMDHHRDGGYAGGYYTRPIYSTDQWNTYATLFTFDEGDTTHYAPRTGIRIALVAHGAEGELAGYIDQVIVSVPYHEDQWGNDVSGWVQFPDAGTLLNRGEEIYPAAEDLVPVCLTPPSADFGGIYCVVDMADFAVLTGQWLQCGWSDVSMCD